MLRRPVMRNHRGRAEPRQHPPFLCVQEGHQCRDESREHFERIGNGRAEAREAEPARAGLFGPLGAQAVVQLAADAAHRDDVALLSDLGNAGRPAIPWCSGAGNVRTPKCGASADEPAHEGRIAFLFGVGFAEFQRQRHRKDRWAGTACPGDLPARAVGKGFGHGRPMPCRTPEWLVESVPMRIRRGATLYGACSEGMLRG